MKYFINIFAPIQLLTSYVEVVTLQESPLHRIEIILLLQITITDVGIFIEYSKRGKRGSAVGRCACRYVHLSSSFFVQAQPNPTARIQL